MIEQQEQKHSYGEVDEQSLNTTNDVSCENEMNHQSAGNALYPVGGQRLPDLQIENFDRADQLIRIDELTKRIGMSRSWVYDVMNEKSKRHLPGFPKRRRLGKRATAWRLSEVIAWIHKQPEMGSV